MAAGRTSTSIGVGVTVTILAIATLALFVTTIVFYAGKSGAQKKLAEQTEVTKEFVSDQDRANDAIQQIKAAAAKERKTAMAYLLDTHQNLMQKASGSKRDTLEDLVKKMESIEGGSGQNLLALLRDRDSQLGALKKQLADAEVARDRALQDRETEVARMKGLEDAQKATLASINAELDKYRDEVERYRGEINDAKSAWSENVTKVTNDFSDQKTALSGEIDKLQADKVLNTAQLRSLQDQLKGQRPEGQSESALVDATVIGLDPTDGSAIVNVGRKQKVVLGMSFEVYSEATAIRPDEEGRYPAGKASLEVIKVDEASSTCRILREKRGNPIVRGDVVANAVFDPHKTYKMLVYGNFDTNGDGVATPQEQIDIRTKITGWGGQVVDNLQGDLDFVVLGERPVLPPEPTGNSPLPVIDEYVRLRKIVTRYDELLNQATATSIPVLNQNRLYTLTGWTN